MNDVVERVFCSKCGALRIHQPGSRYAVCPNGCGRLVGRFTKKEVRQAIAEKLPVGTRVRGRQFSIDGQDGLFTYERGNGRRRAEPGQKVGENEILARHMTKTRMLIRVFTKATEKRRRR